MQVTKWGNSLAVRLPATVVQALELRKESKSSCMSWASALLRSPARRSPQSCLSGCVA